MRAALYARFSTDLQSPTSIADQLYACRRLAERLGVEVVEEFTDAAISGQAISNRPGLVDMLAAARRGDFELVIAEDLDRLSRSGGGTWDVYDELDDAGVKIHTIADGEVQEMAVGLKGTMSALYIKGISRKTRRGLEGVVRSGRSGGGLTYGYAVKRGVYAANGDEIRGLREIDPAPVAVVDGKPITKADVVRRIFREYAAGAGYKAISGGLNRDGIPGPGGRPWTTSTIAGNAKRGNGVIHNALYRGEIVWGRQTWRKDRRTGVRRARDGDAERIVRVQDEDLRIVDEDLWRAVRARHAAATRPGRPPGSPKRPKRLLSGLLFCGCCGGPMTLTGPKGALRCQVRAQRGEAGCSNGRSPNYAGVEARVLAAVQANLLHPDVIEAAVQAFHAESASRRRSATSRRASIEKERGEVVRRAGRLVDQVAEGVLEGRAVAERLKELEARREALEAELAAIDHEPVALHPNIAGAYKKLVADLRGALEAPETTERYVAREAFRALIREVQVIPVAAYGQYTLELVGDLAALLRYEPEKGDLRLGVGAGARSRAYPNFPLEIRLCA